MRDYDAESGEEMDDQRNYGYAGNQDQYSDWDDGDGQHEGGSRIEEQRVDWRNGDQKELSSALIDGSS